MRDGGDGEDGRRAADDGVQVGVDETVVVLIVVVVLAQGGGIGMEGQDIVGTYDSDAHVGGGIKGGVRVHEPERCRFGDGVDGRVADGAKPCRSRRAAGECLVGETELVDDWSGTIRKAVWNRVAGIGIHVWESECLDDLDLAEIPVDEVGAGEYEEMGLCKVDLDEMW